MNCRPYSTPPPGRTSWWRKLATFGVALALFGGTASAQCTNATSYGAAAAPATVGTPTTISTCSYLAEYSTITGAAIGNQYSFNIATGGYVTVHSGSATGAVIGFGTAPLTVTANNASLFPHWTVNAACTQETGICRTTTITNLGAPACTNATAYPSPITATNTVGVTQTISTCSYLEEYSTVNGTLVGVQYTFAIATGGYVTVRSGSPSGAVVGAGPSPLVVTSTATTLYPHWNVNAACATETGICRTTTITRNGAPACTCTNGTSYGAVAASNALNVTQTISTCSWAGSEYSTVSGTLGASFYTFANNSAGAYVTVHDGSPSGPILGCGPSPFQVTSAGAGTLYPHWNTNASCGTSTGTCYTTTVTYNGAAAACAGSPTAGTIPASFTNCANTPVTIAVTGATSASGITFAWEESDDNNVGDPWAAAVGGSGASTSSYTTPGFVGTRYYRCKVTCTNSGLFNYTGVCQVNQNSPCQFTTARNTGVAFNSIFDTGESHYSFSNVSTDDGCTAATPLTGTTFSYKGTAVTSFRASTNGWMTFNSALAPTAYTNTIGASGTANAALCPFWDDLICSPNDFLVTTMDNCMRYKVVGTLGSGTAQIIIEWRNLDNFAVPSTSINFQVILDENGNKITYRYGEMLGFTGSANTSWSYSLGLNAWSFGTPGSYTDVMALRDEGTTNFDFTPATVASTGLNGLIRVPSCNSEYVFTPAAAYPGPGAAPSAPPANDNIAGAEVLSVNPGPCGSLCSIYRSSLFATATGGIPACSAVTPGNADDDVWFKFTANDPLMSITVYSGTGNDCVVQLLDVTGTTALACVNATGVGLTETLNASGLTPTVDYLIRVYNAALGTPAGSKNDFAICVFTTPLPPTNDECTSAISLTPAVGCSPVSGSSFLGTLSAAPVCTGNADDDVWYKFVAPGTGAIVKVQSVGTYNAAFQVFSSTTNDCLNQTSIACVNSTNAGGLEQTTLTTLTPGNTYFIRIYNFAAGEANGQFTVCVDAGAQCPALSSPADGATFITLPVQLSWGAGQFASGYDVYFDATNPPTTLVSSNQPGTTFNVNNPGPNGTYYWRVQSRNGLGATTSCATRSVIVNIPSCQQPSAVSVATTTGSSATVSWLCGSCVGTYIVEYGAPGFIPGTGASAGAGTVVTSASQSAVISGLAFNTNYAIYVRQECVPGSDYSLNTGPTSYSTGPGCGSSFYDVGGPSGNYPDGLFNSLAPVTICPNNATDKVIVSFSSFQTESGYDPLYVYNGPSTSDPLIASANGSPGGAYAPNPGPGGWWGSVAPTNTGLAGIVMGTGASGCLTFKFGSDGSVPGAGWAATVGCAGAQYTCSTAGNINCGDSKVGFTFGGTNTLPVNGCAFNGGASTTGVSWWVYSAASTQDVLVSTCGTTTMNTRISVYKPVPDCNNLQCVGAVDDAPGCPNGTSTVRFKADAEQTYYIAVSGNAANNGLFTMSLFCSAVCSADVNDNDNCGSATPITTQLQDGMQVLTMDDNSCSYVDGPTTCSSTGPAVGNWYSFNTVGNVNYRAYVVDNSVNGAFTAQQMKYALFDGSCTDLLASGPVTCNSSGAGFTNLPVLAPNSPYKLFVYNDGSSSQVGSFGVWVDNAALYDADVTAVTSPTGTVCNLTLSPVVTLQNNGEATLTAADLDVSFDGGPAVATYHWTGSLAPGASTSVVLPLVNVPAGAHTITVTAQNPNAFADQIPSNDGASSAYDATGQTVVVTVKTGSVGAQCTWVVYDAFFFPVGSGGPYTGQNNQTIATEVCLATTFGSCFYFYVYDNLGDGLANAGWDLNDSQGRSILRDNGAFIGQSPPTSPASASYIAHEFCLPLGPSPIQAAECNVFNNYLNNKVYTTTVSGATNYQFEFSDPNAGFYRRISLPRNWVKFGEMVTTPLVYGTTYYCRARADQGAAGFTDDFYGAGCEMALAPSQPVCTELMSTPGTTFSCGVTKPFGGSAKIWAQPVTYATQYRFSFVGLIDPDGTGPLPAANGTRNILQSSYVCPLNWFTYTLVNGQTYNVSVECFVGGVWSGYCGAVCQVTILNNPSQNIIAHVRTEGTVGSDNIQLWPNPVRDGQVNLLISDLTDANQTITVDVYDVYGKRVMAQHYENAGEVFNQVLDLDESMAAGMYTVNITVNGNLHVERLNVVR